MNVVQRAFWLTFLWAGMLWAIPCNYECRFESASEFTNEWENPSGIFHWSNWASVVYEGSGAIDGTISSAYPYISSDSVVFMTGTVMAWFKGVSSNADIYFRLRDTTTGEVVILFLITPEGTDNPGYRLNSCGTGVGPVPSFSDGHSPIPNGTWFKATITITNAGTLYANGKTASGTVDSTLKLYIPDIAETLGTCECPGHNSICSIKRLEIGEHGTIYIDSVAAIINRLAPITFRDSTLNFSTCVGGRDSAITKYYNPGCTNVNIDSVVVSPPFYFVRGDNGVIMGDSGEVVFEFYPTAPGTFVDTAYIYYDSLVCCPALLVLEGTAIAGTVSVDSVWFWEETDCNDSNIVHICYSFSTTCPESSYEVEVAISPDSGSTWFTPGSGWFNTFTDSAGDFGSGVAPGTHCFNWIMSVDFPDTEGTNWMVRVQVVEARVFIDSFSTLDSSRYVINGNDGYVDPDSGYFVLTQNANDRNGRLVTVDSFFLDDLHIRFSFKFSPSWCDITPEDTTGADGMSVIFTPHTDPPLATGGEIGIIGTDGWGIEFDSFNNNCGDPHSDIDGNHTAISLDSISCYWDSAGTSPIPYSIQQVHLPFELVDGNWHDVEIDIIYPHCRVSIDGTTYIDDDFSELPSPFWAHIGFSASTGGCKSEQVIDNLAIYSPSDIETVYVTAYAVGPLDSRPPRVSLTCPDTMHLFVDDTIPIFWTSEDLFPSNSPDSIWVIYGDTSIGWETSLDSLAIPPLPLCACDSVAVAVAVRDSFCNIAYDTCRFALCTHSAVKFLCPPCWQISSCQNQEITAVMFDSLCNSVPESVEVSVIVVDSLGVEDTIPLVGPSSQVYFEPAGDSTIIHITGVEFSDKDSVAVLLNRIKTNRGCWENLEE